MCVCVCCQKVRTVRANLSIVDVQPRRFAPCLSFMLLISHGRSFLPTPCPFSPFFNSKDLHGRPRSKSSSSSRPCRETPNLTPNSYRWLTNQSLFPYSVVVAHVVRPVTNQIFHLKNEGKKEK